MERIGAKQWHELAIPSDSIMVFMPVIYIMYKKGIISEEEYNKICEKVYYPSSMFELFTKLDEIIKAPTTK